MMAGKTMSDFIRVMNSLNLKKSARFWHTGKLRDMRRLKNSGLPTYEEYSCTYLQFNPNNPDLKNYLQKYEGFCVRAIPTAQGLKKGLTRKPKFPVFDFQECRDFLEQVISSENQELYDILLTEWQPQIYGGVLRNGFERGRAVCGTTKGRFIEGEIAEGLDKLTAGETETKAYFFIDRANLGRFQDIAEWIVREEAAKNALWKAFEHTYSEDEGSHSILPGYLEFVVTQKGDVKFLDFKKNPAYLKG